MVSVCILDGYVDEPTCLGVPPYISPYPRYIAGSILGVKKDVDVYYLTIDELRKGVEKTRLLSKSDVVVVVAGMVVPGRYLGGFPASPKELLSFLGCFEKPLKVLCGPAAKHGFGLSGGRRTFEEGFKDFFDLVITGDAEVVLRKLVLEGFDVSAVDPAEVRGSAHEIREFAIRGARVVEQHPNFPSYIIAEVETYRGCPRAVVGGCSFCSEPFKGLPDFRPVEDVVDEVASLYKVGVRHFRLGNQPCFFSYMSKGVGELEFPQPNPDAVEKLLRGLRRVAPEVRTLHIDNVNPGVVARYPEECRMIAKSVVRYHTPGDVAAFGVESADPDVIRRNNLKVYPEDAVEAVRLINEVGKGRGFNGLPELLPGINLVFGLMGESKKTFEYDYGFLKQLLEEGLLVRRINLRQVMPLPGTRMYESGERIVRKHRVFFRRFKRLVRESIDRPMLKRVAPVGTVLRDVYAEGYEGNTTFGRQLGSYPLLVGVPGRFTLGRFMDVKVVGYGYRSLTAVPYPLHVNSVPRETLEALPGVGRKRALRIIQGRPFSTEQDFLSVLDDPLVGEKILGFGVSLD